MIGVKIESILIIKLTQEQGYELHALGKGAEGFLSKQHIVGTTVEA